MVAEIENQVLILAVGNLAGDRLRVPASLQFKDLASYKVLVHTCI